MAVFRPRDDQYWVPNWSSILFAGDLFAAIPFLDQPTVTLVDEEGSGKHFVGEVQYGYGLLVTPTCDMIDQRSGEPSHPYRVLVPVLPLALAERAPGQRQNLSLIEARDSVHPYMYLPPVPGLLGEALVACLYRPSLVDDALLRDPPRRVHQEARRQLKIQNSHATGAASTRTGTPFRSWRSTKSGIAHARAPMTSKGRRQKMLHPGQRPEGFGDVPCGLIGELERRFRYLCIRCTG
jgi:hypothetical protein